MTGVSGLRAVAEVRFSLPSDGRAGVADPDTYRGNPAMRLRVSNFFHCEFAGAPPSALFVPIDQGFRTGQTVANDRVSAPDGKESVVGAAAPGRGSAPHGETGPVAGASPDREFATDEGIPTPDGKAAPVR